MLRPIVSTLILTAAIGLLCGCAYADFTGVNQPGDYSEFSFVVGADVTNLSLNLTNTPQAWSHLLLRKGSPPTDQDFDFISQFDGRDNSINLELPELSQGTWYLRVRTPASSAAHTFTVSMLTNVTDMRSSTRPAGKHQHFDTTGSLVTAQWHYYRVEIPAGSAGWRLVLNSVGSAASLYVRKDYVPTIYSYAKSEVGTQNATIVFADTELSAGGAYFIGIYTPSGSADYQLFAEQGYLTALQWDPGATHLGTEVFSNTSTTGGAYYFKITTQTTTVGAWRTALNVQSGEANLYVRQGALPTTSSYNTKSDRPGSDGFVVNSSYIPAGQDWYIMVQASPGAQWNLVTGEAYVRDLGLLAADGSSSSGEVAVGAEGIRFFRTAAPADTPAWRLWLNGASNAIYVKKGSAPLPSTYDLSQSGQMLVVPPYLDGTSTAYFVAVAADPGTAISLDSRKQAVSDLSFNGSVSETVSGFGYLTYRVQVPVEQIAWQIRVLPSAGNPNVAVRRNTVPSERDNDAYSDVAGSAEDSISLVPPTLSDGTFYITVYGTGAYSFTLSSGNPTITDIAFASTTPNDQPNLAGWRYYRVADIQSQLGCLGWELLLSNQVPGTEIAIRRNAVPGRWKYRANGNSYDHNGHVDYFGIGSLQRPGHQADIWYVGIYMPTTQLGDFTLTARTINADSLSFDGGTAEIASQAAGSWRFWRVDVPSGPVGWDLRLTNVTSGVPRIVVRRDQLPNALATDNGSGSGWQPYRSYYASWLSGYQWAATDDWCDRCCDSSGTVNESGRILATGMGNPLEPGTYYVGVTNSSGASAMSCTLLSRGIGNGMSIPVVDVPFDGGSSSATAVPSRGIVCYRVTVPEDTPSWQARLNCTLGEAMMKVQRQTIPNILDSYLYSQTPYSDGGEEMRKAGSEQWVLLPDSGTDCIQSGDYYVIVESEGQNPPNSYQTGAGSCDWTFESRGAVDVNNLGTVAAADLVQADTLEGGAVRAYQFTVPAGTQGVEIRLEDRTGNPMLKVVQGSRLPRIEYQVGNSYYDYYDYYGNYGGETPASRGQDQVTLLDPVPGVYTVVVNASDGGSGTWLGAGYTLRVRSAEHTLAFDGGSASVIGQQSGTWRFFRVDVPAEINGEPVAGWDLRLADVASGLPRLVVRRDQQPNALATDNGSGSGWQPWYSYYTPWPSGYQWAATDDWCGRRHDLSGTVDEYGRILAMGMGNPLEPGTYYVGVTNSTGAAPTSYTLLSRGIGTGMSIPLVDVPFDGGSSSATAVPPRGVVCYCVTVPENAPSWQARLNCTLGEAMMKVQRMTVPNIIDYAYGSIAYCASPHTNGGEEMWKEGDEQWVLLPDNGTDYVQSGDYYIIVESEGQNPPGSSRIGTGNCDWTFESHGAIDTADLGTIGTTDLVRADTLEGGAAKAYQFAVPVGTQAVEVRLDDRSGSPLLKVAQGSRLPSIEYKVQTCSWSCWYNYFDCYGSYGGDTSAQWNQSVVTIANPTPGPCSLVVNASDGINGSGAGPDAGYTVVARALTANAVGFDGGASSITDQAPGSWRFFRVDVPVEVNGEQVVGWDVRLTDVTSGLPRLVVRRDQLPNSVGTSGMSWDYATWPSGAQWAADQDWCDRERDSTGTIDELGRILSMGMSNPLEPGTYYVGVMNSSGTEAADYTFLSRGIGVGMAIPVVDVAFDGGSSSATAVPPREVVCYRVVVPESTPSWQARLNCTLGEAMMKLRWQKVPSVHNEYYRYSESPYQFGGKEMRKAGSDQWVLMPNSGSDYIPAGAYYVVAESEGRDSSNPYWIGTGDCSWTFESVGAVDIYDMGAVGITDLVQAHELEGGSAKAYQFTVPEGTLGIEVSLEDRVGFPKLKVRQGSRLPEIRISRWRWSSYEYYDYYGNYGGESLQWMSQNLVTVPNPAPGVYSVIVHASDGDYEPTGAGPDAGYTLKVRRQVIAELNFTSSQNGNGLSNGASGELANEQSVFFKVVVPSEADGGPVVGWRLRLSASQGTATVRVRKDMLPDSNSMQFSTGSALITPPYLTPGTWYIEVKASGSTSFTVTSMNLRPERPAWIMPLSGEAVTTPGLEGTPFFGDTGVDADGVPLPGDQGIDLENGYYHYYAVVVPENNAVLLRTMLEAISGNPDLYIRVAYPPTLDHSATGQSGYIYDRTLTGTATDYGNWVPINGRTQSYLAGGTWYLAVKAAGGTNCRYRLRASAGDIQELPLNDGSYSGQMLAGKDWRYYKVSIPWDAPANWLVTFGQQLGDVVMYVRDTSPPGNTTSGTSCVDWGSNYPYGDDVKNNGPYASYDQAGTQTFAVPPIRPGHTYYLGFRANSDATFSVSSASGGGTFADPTVIPFRGGTSEVTIPGNGSAVFRVDVPSEADFWRLSNTHSSAVSVYMEQGTMPYRDGTADSSAIGATNSSFQRAFDPGAYWPWLPGYSYYILAVNTSATPQAFGIQSIGIEWQGVGTSEDPYLVATPEDLDNVRYALGNCFRQIADIDLGSAPWTDGSGWQPIGTSAYDAFTGRYDGGGYTIRNLTINRPSTHYVGLFGYAYQPSLTNIHIEQAVVAGYSHTGALVGYQAGGIITGCGVGGSVNGNYHIGGLAGYTGAAIRECRADCSVGGSQSVGGLIGILTGSVMERSYSAGSVMCAGSPVGGLVGWLTGSTGNNVYSTASVSGASYAGGLIGEASGSTITNAYACGGVLCSANAHGGLIGYANSCSINQSYWDIISSGQATSDGGTGKSTSEMLARDTYTGWDFDGIWQIREGVTYPYFLNDHGPVYEVVGINDGKLSPDGRMVSMGLGVVSAAWNDVFYAEAEDRSAGIRVQKASHGILVGSRVRVTGVLKTNTDGERYIEADSVTTNGSGMVEVMALVTGAIGGGDWFYDDSTGAGQRGVFGGTGLNNIGLLVGTWGRVTGVGTGYLYVDDGSGLIDGTMTGADPNAGIRVICDPTGYSVEDKIAVTGISSCFGTPVGPARRILTRGAGDVRKITGP